MHRLRRPTLILVLLGLLTVASTGCATAGRKAQEQSLLAQVNAERAAVGIGPVAWCAALGRAADAHAIDQAAHNTMTHVGSDGSDLSTRVARSNYHGWTALGENVAEGYTTPGSVLAGWMDSSGHRANILDGNFTHMGSAIASSGNGTRYWAQDFGTNGAC